MMNLISSGVLKKNDDLKDYKYKIAKLELKDMDRLIKLHEMILGGIDDRQLCVPITPEEFERMLNGKGFILGVIVEEELVGFRGVLIPGSLDENLGLHLGLSEMELEQVAHLEITNVHPDFRGNALQKETSLKCLQILQSLGEYPHVFSLSSPFNYPSVKNLLGCNMMIIGIEYMYENRLRYIYYKNLQQSVELDFHSIIEVPVNDVQQQKELLRQGFYGYEYKGNKNNEGLMLFAKDKN